MKKNLCVLITICICLLCGCGNTKKEGEVSSDKSVNEWADLIQEKTEYAMKMKIELDNEDDVSLLESSIG